MGGSGLRFAVLGVRYGKGKGKRYSVLGLRSSTFVLVFPKTVHPKPNTDFFIFSWLESVW